MNVRNFLSVKDRRNALERERGIALPNIGSFSLDETTASTRHCENMIGVAQIPMGIAGPLRISSNHESRITNHDYYIPLATTEGALVASINRGCKAITQSGGAAVDSYRVGVTRGSVFGVENLKENDRLNVFLEENFDQMQAISQTTSSHLTLTKYFSRGLGKQRYVRFVFNSQDAMGMNMATIATAKLVAFIKEKTGIGCVSVAGNYDVDKKPSWLNVLEGRGIKVWAEATIAEKTLIDVLKTTAKKVFDVWLAKCMIGSAMSGSMGYNAQYANVAAALFLATGQDLAHVAEASVGITTAEVIEKDLYVSVHMPDLMVGTVGGGTGLATQKEALSVLGVAGASPAGENGKNAEQFAEIVGAAVLAGEISLLASLSEGTLARAHEKLARGK